ncbi:transcriptional regulator [Granulicella sp. WH15]|uniref:type IV toxin-antitoxin system AbiEi family antitoxin domain-containing protein n=1 Tax=Granulicella sp. WH15 TaxID=2602070 RepID=UPI001367252D|nr:transcriptional regulator [Granulicella sp. WH15]QHN03072.1 transcriptional regulator [Granulicella sp. WH15]
MSRKAEHIGAFVQERTLVRSNELKGLPASRSHLWNLAKAGKIERVGHGLYRSKEAPLSAYETLLETAKRVPRGVLCLSSALRYHELTSENPFEVWLAIERGSWTPKMDYPPVRIVHYSKATFEFGIESHSVDGGTLRVYSPAKTVADCFKFRSKVGIETAIQALRAAYREKKASMDDLWDAAKVCRVVNVMRPYMESLI